MIRAVRRHRDTALDWTGPHLRCLQMVVTIRGDAMASQSIGRRMTIVGRSSSAVSATFQEAANEHSLGEREREREREREHCTLISLSPLPNRAQHTQSCKLSSVRRSSDLDGQSKTRQCLILSLSLSFTFARLCCLVSLTNHNPSTSYNLTSIDQFSFTAS